MSSFTLQSEDKHEIFVHAWPTDNKPRAVMLIAHGMSEHGARYAALAAFLNQHGLAVYAIDHRGHGNTALAVNQLGDFIISPSENGWENLIGDLHKVAGHLGNLYPATPLILLGHSMGSFISLGFTIRYGKQLIGLIISGGNSAAPSVFRAGRMVARLESLRQGFQGRSNLLANLSFTAFNKSFQPARTGFDWLSRDPQQVDLYIKDPLCGFRISNRSWVDLFGGLIEISQRKNLARIPSQLPVYILGGTRDPVGGFGKGLQQLSTELQAAGVANVKLRLYQEGRHEMFNETNRDEVFNHVIEWIDSILS